MAKRIEFSEYFGNDWNVGLSRILKDLNTAIVTMDKFIKSTQQLSTTIQQGSKSQKEIADNTNKVSKNLDILAQKEQQISNIEKQYQTLLAKTGAERTKEGQQLQNLKILKQSQSQQIKEEIQLNKAAKGSYDELNIRLKQASREYKSMSAAERQSAKGKELLGKIKGLQTQLKETDKTMGNHQRNVGNYQSALQALPAPLAGAVNGFKALSAQLWALISNPIVATIAAIAAGIMLLIKAMKRSEEGQDRLNKAMYVLQSLMDNLLDPLEKVGNMLFDLAEKPQKAFKNLGQIIQDHLMNRLKAFAKFGGGVLKIFQGEFKEGIKQMANASLQLLSGVEDPIDKLTAAGKKLVKEMEEDTKRAAILAGVKAKLDRAERYYMIENAKLAEKAADKRARAEELKYINAEEGVKILTDAFQLEKQIAQNEIELAKVRAYHAKEKASLAKSDKDTLMEVARLETDVINKRSEYLQKEREETRRLNMLRMQALQQSREQFKIELQNLQYIQEQQILSNKAAGERLDTLKNEMQIRKEIAIRQRDIEIAEINDRLSIQMISEENATKMIESINLKHTTEMMKIDQDYMDRKEEMRKKDIEAQEKELYNTQQTQNTILADQLQKRLITSEKYAEEILKLEIETLGKKLELAEIEKSERERLEEELSQKRIDLNEKVWDNRKEQINEELSRVSDIGNAIFDINSSMREREIAEIEDQRDYELSLAGNNEEAKAAIEKKYDRKSAEVKTRQAIAEKENAIFNAAINTAAAIVKALPNVALSIFAGILGGLQIAKIAATPIPKFASGVTDFHGGVAVIGERGRELVFTNQGAFISPSTATDVLLPRGSSVIPNKETELYLSGGITEERLNELIKSNREIKKAILNRPEKITKFTKDGMTSIYRSREKYIEYVDKYIRK